MPTFTVKITDKGSAKTAQAVFGKRDSAVKVGVLDGEGSEKIEKVTIDSQGRKRINGKFAKKEAETKITRSISVLDLAAIHEFGLGVPERSFIRSYFDEHGEELGQLMMRLMKNAVLKSIRTGQPITDQIKTNILTKVGLMAVGGIQQRMANGEITPPLAQSTIDRKGSSTPLVDTGQLRSSISYKVEL